MKVQIGMRPPFKYPEGFRKFPYCTGKYVSSIVGKEVEANMPVWAELHRDKDGPYYKLYTYMREPVIA
jgi:hypothetical protein